MHASDRNAREVVVVLHGFGGSSRWTTLLCRRISRSGRRIVNWGYSSWRHSIDTSAGRLVETVNELHADDTVEQIHFVAYSMGSIICRTALIARRDFEKLGRVVMLGPPNRGSHVATFFKPLVGRFVPAVRELCAGPESFVNGLPRLHGVQVGIIAAQRDRIVRYDNTHLPCQREHVLVRGGHTGLLFSREVARMALDFVESGTFAAATETVITRPVSPPNLGVSPLGTGMTLEQV